MRYRTHLVTAALSAALLLASTGSWAQISISVHIAPPPLPVYTQPALPGPGYLWTPGYWAWADGGYYWVPGTWVEPPQPGLLWTPGYWGWDDGAYVWNEGYWAPQVGFYGGVDYGFGYDGVGFAGGYWSHGAFFYNRAVNRIPPGARIPHVYSRPVPQHTHSRASFNGGRGGITAHATAAQLSIGRAHHVAPIAAQRQQEQAAGRNPEFRATANHGRPPVGATARPGQFATRGTPAASGNVRIPERAPAHPARPAVGAHPATTHATPHPSGRPEARPEAPHAATPNREAQPPHEAQPREAAPQRPEERPAERRPEAHGPAPAHAAPRPPAARAAPAEHREPQQ